MEKNEKKVQLIVPTVDNKKLRVAAYCRVSTYKDDQYDSLQSQMDFYDEYIKKHSDWMFAGIYYDFGVSGKKKSRTGLLNLLKEAEQKNIDLIITKSVSRLSRNTIDCLEIVRGLSSLGIGIIFEREKIDTRTMDSELILSILSSIAQYESESTSKNVVWNIHKSFEIGKYKESVAPFGYILESNTYVVNTEEAKIVENIYSWYLNGLGTDAIVTKLKAEYPIRKWNVSSVLYILKNPIYTGDLYHNKSYKVNNKQVFNKGERPLYVLENNHPALITVETFKKVQKLMDYKRKLVENTPIVTLKARYSKKLKCTHCGKYYRHQSRPEGYSYWYCGGRKVHICNRESILEKCLDLTLTVMIKKLKVGERIILAEYKNALINSMAGDSNKYKNELEKKSLDVLSKIEAINKLKLDGMIDDQFFGSKLNELIEQKESIESSILAYASQSSKRKDLINELQILTKTVKLSEPNIDKFLDSIKIIKMLGNNTIEVIFNCGLVLKEKIVK